MDVLANLKSLLVIALVLPLAACQVARKNTPTLNQDASAVSRFSGFTQTVIDCQRPSLKCDVTTPTRTMCRIGNDETIVWLPDRSPHVWADSQCEGVEALKRLFCSSMFSQLARVPVHCLPDPSFEECPIVHDQECGPDVGEAICVANDYLGQPLPEQHRVMGIGDNHCLARQDLMAKACALQLRPSKLSAISCHPVAADKGCRDIPAYCEETYQPTICEVKMRHDGKGLSMMSAWGRNLCHAKAAIRQRMCRSLKSDVASSIQCQ